MQELYKENRLLGDIQGSWTSGPCLRLISEKSLRSELTRPFQNQPKQQVPDRVRPIEGGEPVPALDEEGKSDYQVFPSPEGP